MRRKVRKGRVIFIILALIIVAITPLMVKQEIIRRGYFAIGGEWLLLPLLGLFWLAYEEIITIVKGKY